MKRKMMMMAVCLVAVMLVVSVPLAAQQSDTNYATATTFGTDVDNIVSTTDYSGVVADKYFAFTQLSGNWLNLGYATKIANLYLGTYYNGDLLHQSAGSSKTDSKTDVISVNNGAVTSTSTSTTTDLSDDPLVTDNTVKVLVGVAGMGFRLGFTEYMEVHAAPAAGDGNEGAFSPLGFSTTVKSETTDSATNLTDTSEYSAYSNNYGYMTPSIAWGMNLPLGSMTLVPTANVSIELNQNNKGFTYNSSETKDGGTVYGYKSMEKTYAYNGGYLAPNATVGATLKLAKTDGAQTSFNLKYNFYTEIRTNGASRTSIDQTETTPDVSSVSTKTTNYVNDNKYSDMTHTITPGFSWSKDMDSALSFGVNGNVAIGIEKISSQSVITADIKTVTDSYSQNLAADSTVVYTSYNPGEKSVYDYLTVNPALNLGFVYQVKPSKFNVKGGLHVKMPNLTRTTETYTTPEAQYIKSTTTDGTGAVTASSYSTTSVVDANSRTESQKVTTSWGALATNVYFGSTFNFNEKFSMDLSTSLGIGNGIKLFDMTAAGNGLLTNEFSVSFIVKN